MWTTVAGISAAVVGIATTVVGIAATAVGIAPTVVRRHTRVDTAEEVGAVRGRDRWRRRGVPLARLNRVEPLATLPG
jgi:hypothetical protein